MLVRNHVIPPLNILLFPYRADTPNTAVKCMNFTMPMHTTKNKKGKVVSLSDHEFLQADFLIEKLLPVPVAAPPSTVS